MALSVTVFDELGFGKRSPPFQLELASERLRARDLIARRVEREVADYNQTQPEYFHGLVQPTDAERDLNGYRMRARRRLCATTQTELACEAFESGRFLLLVDDRQVERLDDELVIGKGVEVVFVKLVPLVGG
jgi:hypothetical protein